MLIGFKRGVIANNAHARKALHAEAESRGWWPFAYTILEEVASTYKPDDEPLVERLYRSMAGGDQIFKITRAGRLAEVDERLVTEVIRMSTQERVVRIHDVGVSNGITTAELFERLACVQNVEILGSDLYDSLYLVQPQGSAWTCIFDEAGRCLQIVGYGWVLSGYRRENRRYFGNRWLQQLVWSHTVPRARDILNHWRTESHSAQTAVRTLRLWHPLALNRAEADSRLKFARRDLFALARSSAHVVRVFNVLTTGHFPLTKIREGVRTCLRATADDGILVLGRSVDDENRKIRATAYRKRSDNSAEVIWRINEGYEHEDLVTAMCNRPS